MYYYFVNQEDKMKNIFTLSFKITNWCDLNCAHCCENSGPKRPGRFLPLEKTEKYLNEFKELPYNLSEYVVIGGGEGLSPYLFDNFDYIPNLLHKINSIGGVSTIKTNGVWGNNASVRKLILKDLAIFAHKIGKVVTLDISVDEFHNNTTGVANIFEEILSDEYLAVSIRPTFVGFNTPESAKALSKLKAELTARKILIIQTSRGDLCVYNEDGQGMFVITDYNSEIFDLGRAKKNKVFTHHQTNPGLLQTNCIQIDNNDVVTMNNFYREKIDGRPLNTVIDSLIQKAK